MNRRTPKLIQIFILIAILIHLGWLMVELYFIKQSLANEYQEVEAKLKIVTEVNNKFQNWKFLQARINQLIQ